MAKLASTKKQVGNYVKVGKYLKEKLFKSLK